MEQICAVTVRYFGGVLLGAGGLIRAYSRSVSEALDATDIYEVKQLSVYQLDVDYSTASKIEKWLSNVRVLEKSYEEVVKITFASEDKEIVKKTEEVTLGKYSPVYLYDSEVEIIANGL